MNNTKININIAVTGSALEYAKFLNAVVVQQGSSDINFQQKAIPHVTLLMGELSTGATLKAIITLLESQRHTFAPFLYNFSPPHLVKPGGKFCFLNITNNQPFFELKHRLADLLIGLVTFDFHGGPDNPPHLTFGYFNQPQVSLPVDALRPLEDGVLANCLQICSVGLRGTCTEILASLAFESEHKTDY